MAAKKQTGVKHILLVRHGQAQPRTEDRPDGERTLTAEGHARMKEISRALARLAGRPDAILTSPLIRCVQTALWLARAWGGKLQPQASDALAPGAGFEAVRALVESVSGDEIVLVGHEPDLSEALSGFTGARSGTIEMKKGGAALIRLDATGATIEWILPPKAMKI